MDLAKVWEEILFLIESKMTKQGFDTWFSSSRLLSFDGAAMHIEVPSKFHRDWIKDKHWGILTEVIREVTKKDSIEIEFAIPPQETQKKTPKPAAREDKQEYRSIRPGVLDKKYTFNTFVVGPSNQFAHASAMAVAQAPGRAYNPLFIYSGVGLGKTHLVNAIGHHVQSNNTRAKVAYVSSEEFTNELITHISRQKMEDFRQKFRNMDILIIDDIQFISGKDRTKEEFFHTFNALYESQKQIVLTSDRQPKEIPDIEDRLRSRFEAGLIADIQPPDLETRIAILMKKAQVQNIRLPDDVAKYLATVLKNNIRELEGGLMRLGAIASLTNMEITVDLAKNEMKHLIDTQEKAITNELIQKLVAESFGLRPADLKSKRRTKNIVLPRQVAMFLCRQLAGSSLQETGNFFGGKDHSTVIHAVKTIEEKKEKDPDLKARIDVLIRRLKN